MLDSFTMTQKRLSEAFTRFYRGVIAFTRLNVCRRALWFLLRIKPVGVIIGLR